MFYFPKLRLLTKLSLKSQTPSLGDAGIYFWMHGTCTHPINHTLRNTKAVSGYDRDQHCVATDPQSQHNNIWFNPIYDFIYNVRLFVCLFRVMEKAG